MVDVVAQGYDAVYGAWFTSPTFHEIWTRHAVGGQSFAGFEHLDFADCDELRRILAELHLRRGERLVDLACGAGGPGLWVAREAGAELVGVDLSPVGLGVAASRAVAHHVAPARFVATSAIAIGLRGACAAGVMSVDSIQYVADKRAAFDEVARLLRAGGRFVFTAFELDPGRVAGLPVLGDDPVEDYSAILEEGGFRVDTYGETPGWKSRLDAAYGAIVAARDALTAEMGEEAMGALLLETTITLELEPYGRRVLAVAVRP